MIEWTMHYLLSNFVNRSMRVDSMLNVQPLQTRTKTIKEFSKIPLNQNLIIKLYIFTILLESFHRITRVILIETILRQAICNKR